MALKKNCHSAVLEVGLGLIIVIFLQLNSAQSDQISDKYFSEKLEIHSATLKTRVNYEPQSDSVVSATLRFYAMGRNLTLSLKSDNSILHPEFAVYSISKDGEKINSRGKPENFFVGFVNGNQKRKAHGVLVKGRWFAHFEGPGGQVFVLEPAPKRSVSSLQSVIVYEASKSNSPVKIKKMDRLKGKNQLPAKVSAIDGSIGENDNASSHPWTPNKEILNTKSAKGLQKYGAGDNIAQSSFKDHISALSADNRSDFKSLNLQSIHDKAKLWPYEKIGQNRQAGLHGACRILAIVDYESWKKYIIGFGDDSSIVSLLAFVFQLVAGILGRRLPRGVAVQLSAVYIQGDCYDASVKDKRFSQYLCNVPHGTFNVSELLCKMSLNQDYKKYCIVHLSTARYLDGLFGSSLFTFEPPGRNLEELRAEDKRAPGHKDERGGTRTTDRFVNTSSESAQRSRYIGLSTLEGCNKRVLPLGVYARNLADQIARSWGGGQDDEAGRAIDNICVSGQQYIHYRDDVRLCQEPDGREAFFRTGSGTAQGFKKRAGRQSLEHKVRRRRRRRSSLFAEWVDELGDGGVCGDGLINGRGEDCDPGSLGQNDPCCTKSCKLRASAACSPAHHPCCTRDCQVALSTHKCKVSSIEDKPCVVEETFCDGVDPTACSSHGNATAATAMPGRSNVANASDFSSCGHGMVCSAGKCMRYCRGEDLDVPKYEEMGIICECAMFATLQRLKLHEASCEACCNESRIPQTSCTATEGSRSGEPCVFGTCSNLGCLRTDYRPGSDWDDSDAQAIGPGRPKAPVYEKGADVTALEVLFRGLYWVFSSGMALAFVLFSFITLTLFNKLEGEDDRRTNRERQMDRIPPKQDDNAGSVVDDLSTEQRDAVHTELVDHKTELESNV